MCRRGGVRRGVEIVAERGAERHLVALVRADLLQHRRPEIAARPVQQLAQRTDFRVQPLARPLCFRESGSCLGFRIAGGGGPRLAGGSGGLGGRQRFACLPEAFPQGLEIRNARGLADGGELPVGLRQLRVCPGQPLHALARRPLRRLPPCREVGERALRVRQSLFRLHEVSLDMREMRGRGRSARRIGLGPLPERRGLGGERRQRSLRILDRLPAPVAVALQLGQAVGQFAMPRLRAPLFLVDLLPRDLQPLKSRGAPRLLLAQRLDRMLDDRQRPRGFALQPGALRHHARFRLELPLRRDELRPRVQNGEMHQQRLGPADMRSDVLVAHGLARLLAERFHLRLEMAQHILDPRQIVLGGLEAELRLVAARMEPRDAGRILKDAPPRLRPGGDDLADLPLPHQRRRARTGGGVGEEQLHVAGAGLARIDPVGRAFLALDAARHFEPLGIVPARRRRAPGVVDDQRDFRRVTGGPATGAVEDHVVHGRRAHGLERGLPHHPAHGLDEVRLAAAVRADDARESGLDRKLRRIDEALEPDDAKLLELHPPSTGSGLLGPSRWRRRVRPSAGAR